MIKNVLAGVAAAGLVFAPIAVQAGTRAAEAGVSMDALSRAAAPMGTAEYQADEDDGIPMWLLILLFGAAGGGIIAAIESAENNKSPGT
jgi:hypothetical protein